MKLSDEVELNFITMQQALREIEKESQEGNSTSPGAKQSPAPYTLHPSPFTLHPTPYTRNPKHTGDVRVHLACNKSGKAFEPSLVWKSRIRRCQPENRISILVELVLNTQFEERMTSPGERRASVAVSQTRAAARVCLSPQLICSQGGFSGGWVCEREAIERQQVMSPSISRVASVTHHQA